MAQEFLDFLIALAIVIFAAKLGGYISTRGGCDPGPNHP
jgi:hypothetical protein